MSKRPAIGCAVRLATEPLPPPGRGTLRANISDTMSGVPKARRERLRVTLGVLVAACSAACTDAADIPPTPDLSSLAAEYDEPDAEVASPSSAEAILERFPELEPLVGALRSLRTLIQPVDTARDTAESQGGEGIQLRGGVNVTVNCPGFEGSGEDNGTLSFELAVNRSRILQSFWGHANHCIFGATVNDETLLAELDGDIAIDAGEDIRLGASWPAARLLLSVVGNLDIAGLALGGGLSGRVIDGRVEYLQRVEEGSVVLFATTTGFGLRDALETWYCGTDSGACSTTPE